MQFVFWGKWGNEMIMKLIRAMMKMNRMIFFFILLLYSSSFSFIFRLLLYSSSLFFFLCVYLPPFSLSSCPYLPPVPVSRPCLVRSVLLSVLSLKPLPKKGIGLCLRRRTIQSYWNLIPFLRGNDLLLVSTRTELRARSSPYLLT